MLVDDQPKVLQGLNMLLSMEPDLQIVGEAGGCDDALALIELDCPDVVVIDVEMPGKDGIFAAKSLTQRITGPAVVILTIHDDAVTRARALAAGADAFVSKLDAIQVLLTAIRQAMGLRNAPNSAPA